MIELIVALTVAFNIIIVIWKFRHHRIFDGILDSSALVLVGTVFAGGIASLTVGTIASFMVSLYLLIAPPQLHFKMRPKKTKHKFKPQFTAKDILW